MTTTPKLLALPKAWLTDADLNDCVGGPFNEGAAFARRHCAAELEEAILADRADRESAGAVAWLSKSVSGTLISCSPMPGDPNAIPLYAHPFPDAELRALVEAAEVILRSAPSDEVLIAVGRDDGVRTRPCPLNNVTDGDVLNLRTALAHPALRAFIGSEK
jgi:hypothetical protein